MTTIEGVNPYGSVYRLEVPMTAKDITFGAYLDFLAGREKYFETSDEMRDGIVASALMEALANVVKGDLEEVPFLIDGDLQNSGFDSIVRGVSLARLENHIIKVAKAAQEKKRPEIAGKYEFDYDGHTWYVGTKRAITFLTGIAYSTGEVIEVMEVEELMNMLIDKKGDPGFAYTYEKDLRTVAILAKREGFKMPFEINERLAYLEKQMRYFAGLDLETVMDIRFFLSITLSELRESLDTISSLIGQNPLLMKALETIRLKDQGRKLRQAQSAEARY